MDKVEHIIKTKSLRDTLTDLRKAEVWLLVAAFSAFLASAFFVVKYFVGGDMVYEHWTDEQWLNALLGLGITAVITAGQAFLYQSGYKGQAAIIATFIVVFFGVFSEVSQSMEREDATVRHRSTTSGVYQATLSSITSLSAAPAISSAATSELARAQKQAAEIQTAIDNKNKCQSCVSESFKDLRARLATAKGRVAAAQSRLDAEASIKSAANAAALQGAIAQAKALEYDEDKHYAMIRLLKEIFGVTGVWASFMFSLIIIGTFEYAFHFVGAYVADHKEALSRQGRDKHGRRIWQNETPPLADLRHGKGQIPKDHGLKEEYLEWASPERQDGDEREATRDLFLAVLDEIKSGRLTEIHLYKGKPFTDFIKSQIKGSNPEIEAMANKLVDLWLHPEGIVVSNPQKGAGATRWIIDQKKVASLSPERRDMPDFTNKRFFKLIYTEVRNLVLNGDIKPTVRHVTDAVASIIDNKGQLIGIQPSMIGKPQKQQIAQAILDHLESETIVTSNNKGGIGKDRYVLAEKYQQALR